MRGGTVNQIYRQDIKLRDRMLEGDEAAFEYFVDEYYPRLYRFVYSRMGSERDVCQDVVQSTFAKLMPKLAAYRGEASLFTWMCSFCRFEIAAHWRGVGKRAPEVDLDEDAPSVRSALETLAALDQGPEAEVQRQQLARLVRTTLDYLPIHYGNALEWKYIHGLPVREIAARMQTSEKAVESMLTRARQAFRDGFVAVLGG
jgi:RNA polymerase sigma-70 factor (ECF subfamily)